MSACVKSKGQLCVSFTWIVVLDQFEDHVSINRLAALIDDSVADLTDQHKKTSWCVVVGGIGPDEQDGVHDGHKELSNILQISAVVLEIEELVLERLKELVVLISLNLGHLYLLLQF